MYTPMMLLATLALASGALAQYGGGSSYGSGSSGSGSSSGGNSAVASSVAASPVSSGTASPSGQVKVHVVKVSNKKGDLTFEPNNLQAAAGDMVQFQFYPKVCPARSSSMLAKLRN